MEWHVALGFAALLGLGAAVYGLKTARSKRRVLAELDAAMLAWLEAEVKAFPDADLPEPGELNTGQRLMLLESVVAARTMHLAAGLGSLRALAEKMQSDPEAAAAAKAAFLADPVNTAFYQRITSGVHEQESKRLIAACSNFHRSWDERLLKVVGTVSTRLVIILADMEEIARFRSKLVPELG